MSSNTKVVLLLGFVLRSICSVTTQSEPIVTLSHNGKVKGKTETVDFDGEQREVHTFLGIPFAKPPVDGLRFAKPIPHPGWNDTREATQLPPTCWQFLPAPFDLANKGAKMWLNNTVMDEDCLYLNVWQPAVTQGKQLPVMVWIYGGGLTTGTSTLEVYNGKYIAAKHNVVVVSMQYRLGAFGFLNLRPGEGQEKVSKYSEHAVGNMGSRDQLLALQWVQKEIKNFGGNPSEVTLFGESSGAVSVSSQWASPLTKGLFKRVILQSGNVLARWGLQDKDVSFYRSDVFTASCKCSDSKQYPKRDDKIACLLKVQPLDLVNCLLPIYDAVAEQRNQTMWNNFFNHMSREQFGGNNYPGLATGSYRYFEVPLSVVIDGDFMPKHPAELMKNPTNAPDLLIGVNQDEAIYFLLYGLGLQNAVFMHDNGSITLPTSVEKAGLREPLVKGGQVADFNWITALQILEPKYLLPGLTHPPVQFYGLPQLLNSTFDFANPKETKLTGEEVMKRINDLASDMDFVCPTLDFGDRVARLPNANVYMYYFTQPSSKLPWPNWTGVMHGYEIHYVFGMQHSAKFQDEFFGFTEEEKTFGDQMQQYWVNFAKTGNPNKKDNGTEETVKWPKYLADYEKSPNQMDHLILNKDVKSGSRLRDRECSFWLHLMEHQRTIAEKDAQNGGNMIYWAKSCYYCIALYILQMVWN